MKKVDRKYNTEDTSLCRGLCKKKKTPIVTGIKPVT